MAASASGTGTSKTSNLNSVVIGSLFFLEKEIKGGSIPLQTIRADVDFARERAHLPYGDLGIKVWIYKGEVFSKKQGA